MKAKLMNTYFMNRELKKWLDADQLAVNIDKTKTLLIFILLHKEELIDQSLSNSSEERFFFERQWSNF